MKLDDLFCYDDLLMLMFCVFDFFGGFGMIFEIDDVVFVIFGLLELILDVVYEKSGVLIFFDWCFWVWSYFKMVGLLGFGGRGIWVLMEVG